MLIERAVGISLVNDKHLPAIPRVHICSKEYIDRITINALCASDFTIGVRHGSAPFLTVRVNITAHTSCRIFYRNVE